MNLELKVGGVYKNRAGERVEIVEMRNSNEYPYKSSDGETFTKNGSYYTGDRSLNDLIAEWHEDEVKSNYHYGIYDNTEINLNDYDLVSKSQSEQTTYIAILEALVDPDDVALAKKILKAIKDAGDA